MKRNELYEKAVEKYGLQAQSLVAIEEMTELSKVILKGFRNEINKEELTDEIADVEIMLEQLKQFHKIGNKVRDRKRYKKIRLEKRL